MKTFYVFMIISLLVLPGCEDSGNKQMDSDLREQVVTKPEKSYLTEKQLQDYINKEINLAVDMGNDFVIKEAANVISLIRHTINSLLEKDHSEARHNLSKAIAKAKLIELGGEREVISEVNITISALIQDAETAASMLTRADSLLSFGEVQDAKELLSQLTNEIRITKESISIPDYIQAMEAADVLIGDRLYDRALLAMNSILGKVIVEYSVIPLPVLRAQRMIAEIVFLLNENTVDTDLIKTVLANAEYELKFSELLGYGKVEKEYQNLYQSINDLKESIQDKNYIKSKSQVDELSDELQDFREDISAYKKESPQ